MRIRSLPVPVSAALLVVYLLVVVGRPVAKREVATLGSMAVGVGVHYRRLHLPDSGIYTLGAYGDTVAWGADPAGGLVNSVIDTASLRTGQIRVAAHVHPSTPQLNFVRISARWLSWVEYEPPTGDWRLMAQSRAGGQPFEVDSSVAEGGRSLPPPLVPLTSMDGDTLAWSFSVDLGRPKARTGVWVQVLPHGIKHLVANSMAPCYVIWPAVSGRVVVWDHEGACAAGNSDLMEADWHTGRTRTLSQDHRSSEPETNGRLVAYKAGVRFGPGALALLDLRTGRSRIVDPHGTADRPVLTDRLLAWMTADEQTIIAQDLGSGKQYVLSQNSPNHTVHYVLNGHLGQGWSDEVVLTQLSGTYPAPPDKEDIVTAMVP